MLPPKGERGKADGCRKPGWVCTGSEKVSQGEEPGGRAAGWELGGAEVAALEGVEANGEGLVLSFEFSPPSPLPSPQYSDFPREPSPGLRPPSPAPAGEGLGEGEAVGRLGSPFDSGAFSEAGGGDEVSGEGAEHGTRGACAPISAVVLEESETGGTPVLREGLRRAAFSRRCFSSISEMIWWLVFPS